MFSNIRKYIFICINSHLTEILHVWIQNVKMILHTCMNMTRIDGCFLFSLLLYVYDNIRTFDTLDVNFIPIYVCNHIYISWLMRQKHISCIWLSCDHQDLHHHRLHNPILKYFMYAWKKEYGEWRPTKKERKEIPRHA